MCASGNARALFKLMFLHVEGIVTKYQSLRNVDFVYARLIQMRKHLPLKRNKAISLPRRKNGEEN